MCDFAITGSPHTADAITMTLCRLFLMIGLGLSIGVCFVVLGAIGRTLERITLGKCAKSILAFLWRGSKGEK